MTTLRLIRRSLLHYWRTNLGVALGAAVSSAIIVGALLVGDSVRGTLRRMALSRLGRTQFALVTEGRFFRADLADEIARELSATAAPVAYLRGVLTARGGRARANSVNVLGVDRRFWRLGHSEDLMAGRREGIVVNRALATRLGLSVGDNVVLRVDRPGDLMREAPLGGAGDAAEAFAARVTAIAGDEHFGRFGLRADQVPPLNAYVPLDVLTEKVHMPGRVNVLLLGGRNHISLADAQTAMKKHWRLADAGLHLRHLPRFGAVELRSDRIFLEDAVADAAAATDGDALGILTYFVNELRSGDRATPYSMVAALGPLPSAPSVAAVGPVGPEMRDDEIIINSWLAKDLKAIPGDPLTLKYFAVTEDRGLAERARTFRIRAILPIKGLAADRRLMPDFPGLAGIQNCRDWKPGVDIRFDRIRKVDEEYWDLYRGTPKAFVTLKAGREMWASRFGGLTAVRFGLRNNPPPAVVAAIRRSLDPGAMGLFIQPVRARAIAASEGATDFVSLFLGLSFFIIFSALLLTALLFVLAAEQRRRQVGLMLAVGFSAKHVRWIMLSEGAALAVIGAALGTGAGTAYTKLMLWGLSGVWSNAVAAAKITFHPQLASMVGGGAAGAVAAIVAMYLGLRRQLRLEPRELLSGLDLGLLTSASRAGRAAHSIARAAACALAAGCILAFAGWRGDGLSPAAFFSSGALLLVAGVSLTNGLLKSLGGPGAGGMSLGRLALRYATRRRTRSLAVVTLLACATFLIVAIGVFRRDKPAGGHLPRSGTGGFALYGRSSIPIFDDLSDPKVLESYGLTGADLAGMGILQLRVREGDDASCLNLNRPQSPQLLGVPARQLSRRGAFTFGKTLEAAAGDPWAALDGGYDGMVPAIADETTVKWALHKKVGDTLTVKGERGETIKLLLVAAIRGSILQGSVLISQRQFVRYFPSDGGSRVFLIDAEPGSTGNISDALTRAFRDYGLDLTPSTRRLADFNEVQNTYLSIFQLLGGLGLALGSAGVALVLARNVLERRGQLAMLRAVGFGKRAIVRLVLYEHWALLAGGLACGLVGAIVAVLPAVLEGGWPVPSGSLAITLALVAAVGAGSVLLATLLSLRGRPIEALRHE